MTPQEAIEILTHWADRACEAYCANCKSFTKDCYEYCQGMQGRSCQAFESFKASLEHFCAVIKDSLNPVQNDAEAVIKENLTPGFDADYLQSKIDAFSEARKKDGKTSEELLNECR